MSVERGKNSNVVFLAIPWSLDATPKVVVAIPWAFGAIPWALGAIPGR